MSLVSPLGIVMAAYFFSLAASPSLLPRSWFWHGFITAPYAAFGYFLGDKLEFWLRRTWQSPSAPDAQEAPWLSLLEIGLALVASGAVILAVRSSHKSASQVAYAVGTPQPTALTTLKNMVATLLMAAFCLVLLQILWILYLDLRDWLATFMALPLAAVLAVAAPLVVAFIFGRWIVYPSVMAFFVVEARRRDNLVNPRQPSPTTSNRSGSPASISGWEEVGAQGREFLSRGPTAERIAAVTGGPALEPIRIYAGVQRQKNRKNADLDQIADRAVADLKRAGGFQRSVINVATATGSGWIDEWLVQPLEYMTNGDCATVSMQYSSMFSAVILLRDLQLCADASAALHRAVMAEVEQLPADERPLVILTGESLGAFGSQGTFAALDDAIAGCDGAIWVGLPRAGQPSLWVDLTANRDEGSPEILPVIDDGRHVRFVDDPEQLRRGANGQSLGRWEFPRLVYVQHPSDPVVWYSPSLFTKGPDWLREPRGNGVSAAMRYRPVVTLTQLAVDLPVAGLAPEGRGHTYGEGLLPVWTDVLGYDASGRIKGTWLQAVPPEQMGIIADAIVADIANADARDAGQQTSDLDSSVPTSG